MLRVTEHLGSAAGPTPPAPPAALHLHPFFSPGRDKKVPAKRLWGRFYTYPQSMQFDDSKPSMNTLSPPGVPVPLSGNNIRLSGGASLAWYPM